MQFVALKPKLVVPSQEAEEALLFCCCSCASELPPHLLRIALKETNSFSTKKLSVPDSESKVSETQGTSGAPLSHQRRDQDWICFRACLRSQ